MTEIGGAVVVDIQNQISNAQPYLLAYLINPPAKLQEHHQVGEGK